MKKDAKKNVKKESRLEKVIVTLLVVLVSLLSFSVGVISGKGLSDKEYALKSLDQKYSHAMNEQPAEGDNFAGELSEEEIEQLANAALEKAEETLSNAEGGKNEIVAEEAGKKPLDEERIPSSVKKTAPKVGYTVQIAAYQDEKDAAAKAADLEKKGYAAFPLKKNVKGKTWYKVSIGSFGSRTEASSYKAALLKKGVVKDAIVQPLSTH